MVGVFLLLLFFYTYVQWKKIKLAAGCTSAAASEGNSKKEWCTWNCCTSKHQHLRLLYGHENSKLVNKANASLHLIRSVCLYFIILMGLSFFFCRVNIQMSAKVCSVRMAQDNQLTWLRCWWNLITLASENNMSNWPRGQRDGPQHWPGGWVALCLSLRKAGHKLHAS